MNNHKYKEGLIFEIKSLAGIDNRLYLRDDIISKLYIGDKVKVIYSGCKNNKLEYELIALNNNGTEMIIDGKNLSSDFMSEDEIDIMMGDGNNV